MTSTLLTWALPAAKRSRPELLFDAAVAAAVFAGSLILLSHGGATTAEPTARPLDWVGVVLAAGSAVPLLAWRRVPAATFVASTATCTVLGALGYPVGLTLGPTAALYLLAASRHRHTPWTWHATVTVTALFTLYIATLAAARGQLPGIALLHTGLAWAGAWFAGERTRLRREQLAELNQRAERAEQDADRERLLAVAEERTRIARDLHDSAAHAINVIAVRAGAARLHQDPQRALATLTAVEELARQTAAEIDQIVGHLRDPLAREAVETPPGLASLDTLVAAHTAAGLDVALTTKATPQPLGSTADQAAYRILQEALTNAARHGAGSVRIALTYHETSVEITVTNPGRPQGHHQRTTGHGLIGMRERATLLGGTFATEHTGGTFTIRATLPYGGRRP
jgi:signal transduction histidine kinase